MNSLRHWSFALLFVADLMPLDGLAGTLQVSPVGVELQASESATGVTLRNPGDQAVYGQVRLFRWDQTDGQEKLTPTRDFVASPPLIEVAPRSSQLVRLVRVTQAPVTGEQSYRMLIDELPRADDIMSRGITIRLRYSLPMFIEPPGEAGQPSLSWHLIRRGDGWDLRVDNIGSRRAQIAAVELVSASKKVYGVGEGLLGYALAGHSRQWRIPLPSDADLMGGVRVRATVNSSRMEAVVDTTAAR